MIEREPSGMIETHSLRAMRDDFQRGDAFMLHPLSN
jgi:hypothetical protein